MLRSCSAALACALAAALPFHADAGEPTPLFTVLSEASPIPGTPALSERVAELDLQQVRNAETIIVNAPGHFGIATRSRIELRAGNGFLWYGRTEASDEVLITSDGTYANILITGITGRWIVKPLAGSHQLVQVDPAAEYPPDEVVDPADVPLSVADSKQIPAPDSPAPSLAGEAATIDLLILYTAEARTGAGGDAQIRNFSQHLVDQSNQIFENSLVPNVRYRLRHASLTAMTDFQNGDTMLFALRSRPGLAQARLSYGVDTVILLNEQFSDWRAGVAYIQRNPGPGFTNFAFGVVARYWTQWNPIFAHEAGHILGMEHDPGNAGIAPEFASFPWSFGHHTPIFPDPVPDPGFYTVMSYYGNCGTPCTQLMLFSNPAIVLGAPYAGLSAGVQNQRDNARTANLLGPGNAAFLPETDAIFVADLEHIP